jgi:hypothetical protein
MNPRSSMLSLPGLALAVWLGVGINSASAQSVYFEPYAQPVPIIEPYQLCWRPDMCCDGPSSRRHPSCANPPSS